MIYHEELDEELDELQVALLLFSEIEYLFEFSEIFDRDQLLKFLTIFSGQVIRVPSRKELENKLRNVRIWIKLHEENTEENVEFLSSRYKLESKEIKRIYSKVCNKFEELNLIGKM